VVCVWCSYVHGLGWYVTLEAADTTRAVLCSEALPDSVEVPPGEFFADCWSHGSVHGHGLSVGGYGLPYGVNVCRHYTRGVLLGPVATTAGWATQQPASTVLVLPRVAVFVLAQFVRQGPFHRSAAPLAVPCASVGTFGPKSLCVFSARTPPLPVPNRPDGAAFFVAAQTALQAVASSSVVDGGGVDHLPAGGTLPLLHGILLALQYTMEDVVELRVLKDVTGRPGAAGSSGAAAAAPPATAASAGAGAADSPGDALQAWRAFAAGCVGTCTAAYRVALAVVADTDTLAPTLNDATAAGPTSTQGPSGVRAVPAPGRETKTRALSGFPILHGVYAHDGCARALRGGGGAAETP
jgi:hypothetical protein